MNNCSFITVLLLFFLAATNPTIIVIGWNICIVLLMTIKLKIYVASVGVCILLYYLVNTEQGLIRLTHWHTYANKKVFICSTFYWGCHTCVMPLRLCLMLIYDENTRKLYQSLLERGCFEYKILNYDGCWRQLFFKTMVSFCDGFVVSVCNDALRFLKHVTKYVNDVV